MHISTGRDREWGVWGGGGGVGNENVTGISVAKLFLFQKTGHKVEAVTVAQESFCRLFIFFVVVVGGWGWGCTVSGQVIS